MRARTIVLGVSLLVAILHNTVVAGIALSESDTLRVHLEMDKPAFLVGETIPFRFCVVNRTDRSLAIVQDGLWHTFLHCACFGPTGEKLEEKVSVTTTVPDPLPTRPLLPHDSMMATGLINSTFGSRLAMRTAFRGLQAGTYSLVVYYPRDTKSDELKFTVIDPTASEKQAFDELRDICSQYDIQHMSQAAPRLEGLLEAYPGSVYGPNILMYLSRSFGNGLVRQMDKAIEYKKELIRRYPNSEEAKGAVVSIWDLLGADSCRAFLEQIDSTKEGTKAGDMAHSLLSRIRQSTGMNKEK